MKNEGASLMKCDKPHEKQSVRTSCEHSEHFMTTKLSLYVCNANTSWIEIAITFSEKSRETPVFLLFFTLLADPNRRPCHTQPHRLLTGSEHRAACGRWSGALSRKKQRALRSAPSEQGDYVSDRKGRWFESNRGSHLRSLEPQRVQGFSLF